jgi:tRNA(Arg) A34 adenosine deaminase TadA
MCLGATLWSGVSRIVCAATKADAEAIGFKEGPVFEASYDHLREAGIEVKKEVLQKEAALVLKEYGENGLIYNASEM